MDKDRIEQELHNHFSAEVGEVEPSHDWWNTAVSQAVMKTHRSRWFGLVPKTRLAWVLVPVLVLLVGGTVYGASSVIQELFHKWAAGVEEAGLAQELDLSQTIDGITVRLERAYADSNVVLLGFTVSGSEGYEKYQPGLGRLFTSDGEELPAMIGLGFVPGSEAILGNWRSSDHAAWVVTYDASSLKGDPSELGLILETGIEFPIGFPVEGRAEVNKRLFKFEFDVPFHAGKTIDIGRTVEAAGVPVTLEQVTISPWGVRAVFQNTDGDDYSPIEALTLPDGSEVKGSLGTRRGTSIVQYLMGDFTGQVGEWTMTVSELVFHNVGEPQVRLSGPWEFHFDVS
jgi:hypothetical protein